LIRRFAKLRRDTKALSPIFAVLLLIAIAVIAGIVVYMFTSGYIATMVGGGTAGQEKVAIEAVEVDTVGVVVNVYAISTGGGPVDIVGYFVRDQTGNTVSQGTIAVTLAPGVLSGAIGCGAPPAPGVYTVSLVSSAGSQFVSQSFTV